MRRHEDWQGVPRLEHHHECRLLRGGQVRFDRYLEIGPVVPTVRQLERVQHVVEGAAAGVLAGEHSRILRELDRAQVGRTAGVGRPQDNGAGNDRDHSYGRGKAEHPSSADQAPERRPAPAIGQARHRPLETLDDGRIGPAKLLDAGGRVDLEDVVLFVVHRRSSAS